MAHTRNEKQFSIIMLGTDTYIESINDGNINRMANYEHGETLNAIFRELAGAEFTDKAIVSGVKTQGLELDRQVAEGLMHTLKAISEGKTDIKVAAHSRGAIATMVMCHKLQEIIELIQGSKNTGFIRLEDIRSIIKKNISEQNNKVTLLTGEKKGIEDAYNIYQRKTNDPDNPEKSKQYINFNNLTKIVKSDNFNQKLKLKLHLIDPVPGQDITNFIKNLNTSWSHKYFVELASIVTHAEVIYKLHERSQWFQAVFIKAVKDGQLTVSSSYGHHGSASGNLQSQDNKQLIDRDDKKLLKTRHAQKLMVAKLVDFFGARHYKKKLSPQASEINHIAGNAKSIDSTINSYIKRTAKASDPKGKKAYKLKKYNNMKREEASFKKFLSTTYAGLELFSSKTRQCIIDENGNQKELHEIPNFYMPPSQFVNKEHIGLILSNGHDFIYSIEMINFYSTIFHKGGTDNLQTIRFLCQNDNAVTDASKIFQTVVNNSVEQYQKILDSNISESDKKSLTIYASAQNSAIIQLLKAIKEYSDNTDNNYSQNAGKLHTALSKRLINARNVMSSIIANKLDKLYIASAQNPTNTKIDQLNELLIIKNDIEKLDLELTRMHSALITNKADYKKFKAKAARSFKLITANIKDTVEKSLTLSKTNIEEALQLKEYERSHVNNMEEIKSSVARILNSSPNSYNEACKNLSRTRNYLQHISLIMKNAATQKNTCLKSLELLHQENINTLLKYKNHLRNKLKDNYLTKDEYTSLKSIIKKSTHKLSRTIKEVESKIENNFSQYQSDILKQTCLIQNKISQLEASKDLHYHSLTHQHGRMIKLLQTQALTPHELNYILTIKEEVARLQSYNDLTDKEAADTIRITCDAFEHNDKNTLDTLKDKADHFLNLAKSGNTGYLKLGIALASIATVLTLGAIAFSIATFGLGAIAIGSVATIATLASTGTVSIATGSVAGYSIFKSQKAPKITQALNEYSDHLAQPVSP